jgi:hypothetical protein
VTISEATFEKAESAGQISIDADTRAYIQDSMDYYVAAFENEITYRKVKKTLKRWFSANERKAKCIIDRLTIQGDKDSLLRVCGREILNQRKYAGGSITEWLDSETGILIWRNDVEAALSRLESRFGGGRERHLVGDFIRDLALAYQHCGGKAHAYYNAKNEKIEGKFVIFCEAMCEAMPKPLIAGVSVGDQARRKLREMHPKMARSTN